MKLLLTIFSFCLCNTLLAQPTYTYVEPDPVLEADKKAKEAYFKQLRESANRTLENCLRGCGHFDKGHAHDANDPDPCHHSSSQSQCECNCGKQSESTLKDIDRQEQDWLRTAAQRQKDWENKKAKEQQDELNKQNKLQQQQDLQNQQKAAAQDRLNQQQQQFEEQQRHYQQTQIELGNAKNVSMNAYQEAINSGRKESGAMLDATLAGAQQISDAKSSLIYTGVGLGVSLFMHLSEKKTERIEADASRINEAYRKQLIIDAKSNFLKDLLNISKYSISDLVKKERYAVLIITTKNLEASEQEIYFTLPKLINPFSDSTYPSKESITTLLLSYIPSQRKVDKRFFILYPIINLQEFNNDFIKKIGSGNIIGFNASLIKFSESTGNKTIEGTTDFWGNPIKKDSINSKQKQINKQQSNFWNQ